MEKTKFPIPQEDYDYTGNWLVIEIINIGELYEEKYVDFLWGFTNKKYGLLDTKEGEAY